jgi:hypothetical protein
MLIPARSDLVWFGAKRVTLNRSAGRSLLDHAATSASGAAQPLIDLNSSVSVSA